MNEINKMSIETLIRINKNGYVIDINDGKISNVRIANIRK